MNGWGSSRSRIMRLRAIGWLTVTAMLAVALLGPAASRAADLNPVAATEDCPEGTDGFKIDDTNTLTEGTYTFGVWSVVIYDVQVDDENETASFSFKDASHLVMYVFITAGGDETPSTTPRTASPRTRISPPRTARP